MGNGQRASNERNIKSEDIAEIVDKFLRNKIAESPQSEPPAIAGGLNFAESQIRQSESPVKTIIHELKTENATNGAKPKAVDFVSETDVKKAVENGEKIFVTAKTIITPSARDLGEEKEVFAKV